jgi:hypothetical protein
MKLIIIPKANRNNGVVEPEVATLDDIRAAQYHTAHGFPGGVPALSRLMKMSESTLDKKVSLTNSTHHLSNVEASIMMDVTGDYQILHAMSGRVQHVSISMQVDDQGGTMEKVGLFGKEVGEVINEVCISIKDGDVKPNEMRKIEKEAAQTIAALQRLVADCRSRLPKIRRLK